MLPEAPGRRPFPIGRRGSVLAAIVLGGLVAWGRTTLKLWRGFEVGDVHLSVELCAIYWHFLLVIWLVLFGLLLLT